MTKEVATKVEMKILHMDTHWSGMILVNNTLTSECNGPSLYGVLDALIEAAFYDDETSEAPYAVVEGYPR